MELIERSHFSGQRNISPEPNEAKQDLAVLIRELQGKVNKVGVEHVAIDDTDSPYAVADGVSLVGVDPTTAVVTVTLPAADSREAGSEITVKDEGGAAGTNAITVSGTVDGAANPTISADYGKLTVYTNGTAWFTK